jgi:uncharacterized protein YgiM (DUF1202 family)
MNIISFLLLAYVLNAVINFSRGNTQMRTWGGLLALAAFAGSLFVLISAVLTDTSSSLASVLVVGNALITLVVSLIMLALEARREDRDLNRSFAVVGTILGATVLILSFTMTPIVSAASLLLPGPDAALASQALSRNVQPRDNVLAPVISVIGSGSELPNSVSLQATPIDDEDVAPTQTRMPSPMPTPTRVPFTYSTPTPVPAAEDVVTEACDVVTMSGLNVRSGASTDFPIINSVGAGTRLTAIEQNADASWLKVTAPGLADGWVSADFVTYTTTCNGLQIPD